MKFNDHFLSWVLIYAILVYAVDFLLNLFDINNYLFVLLFAGFIFALGSSIFYSVLYKNDFRLNGWFLIWTLTNALSYWLINLFLSLFTKLQNVSEFKFSCHSYLIFFPSIRAPT